MRPACAMQAKAEFTIAKVVLAAAQVLALCPLLLAIAHTARLPSNVDAQYDVYQSLGTAAARVMLPAKADTFGVFLADAQNSSSAQGGTVPQCSAARGSGSGTSTQSVSMTSQQPEWMLPDDNAGLFKFADSLVRACRDATPPSLHKRCKRLQHVPAVEVQILTTSLESAAHMAWRTRMLNE